MDSWNPDQLKKMQLGGNGRLNSFLKSYGVDKFMDIKDKYNSKAAEVCLQCDRGELSANFKELCMVAYSMLHGFTRMAVAILHVFHVIFHGLQECLQ